MLNVEQMSSAFADKCKVKSFSSPKLCFVNIETQKNLTDQQKQLHLLVLTVGHQGLTDHKLISVCLASGALAESRYKKHKVSH